jgi:hypothetical protein
MSYFQSLDTELRRNVFVSAPDGSFQNEVFENTRRQLTFSKIILYFPYQNFCITRKIFNKEGVIDHIN